MLMGKKFFFEPYPLVVLYKYVHCLLPLLYYITCMLYCYGCKNFDNMTLSPLSRTNYKIKNYLVFSMFWNINSYLELAI